MHRFALPFLLTLAACGGSSTSSEEATAPAATEAAKVEAVKADAAAEAKPAAKPAPSDIPAPDDVAAPPADATKTASGLAFKVLEKGPDGAHPTANAAVKVHYTGWTTDGKMFDSSVKRGKPAQFSLQGVIAGWTEGLQLIGKGDKARFWIPEDLAYKGMAGRPQGMLVFDVELIDIYEPGTPPAAPADVAAPPADAKKTDSGLAYKILASGAGGAHPGPTDVVTVHYTGWTTDGKQFDSSIERGMPAEFPLNRVIPGWTEGLQLLAPGDKARLWIPEALAYKGQPGRPAGMLVFDVELLSFEAMPARPAMPH
ncbi:MAG: FKBP-type peptidyl-prolyl cis-trans isomerase [Alphaproteobacteria bacterium]|nr:FKBP-type peptidyl-prolyl cis-trans isomerase [Alphaproteobacteria bacterium]